MDVLLTEFISKTAADPGLARDLLDGHNWELQKALNAYHMMNGGQMMAITTEKKLPPLLPASQPVLIVTNGQLKPATSDPSLQLDSPSNEESLDEPFEQPSSLKDVGHDVKKLLRGISRATDNVCLVSKVRTEFAQELRREKQNDALDSMDMPEFTFTLPDISIHSSDFREFLEKDLIEKSTLISLKNAGRLNWWCDKLQIAAKLWPLATTGDGNCLLHAASLGMWGFHDRLLTLRKALHQFMIENNSQDSAFYRRWRFQCMQQNKQAGLILCEEEWDNEWTSLLKMASTEPRVRGSCNKKIELNGGKKFVLPEDEMGNHVYESLEEIHILALAHVLRRPIIVIADTMLKDVTGEPFAPIPFGGIYLPLQCTPDECHRAPLCLTYDAAHFSALVAMDCESYADRTPELPMAIPLVDSEGKLLPLQFSVDPGEIMDWCAVDVDAQLDRMQQNAEKTRICTLRAYLDVVHLSKTKTSLKPDCKDNVQDTNTPTLSHSSSVQSESDRPESRESRAAGEKKISRVASQFSSLSRGIGTLRRSMSKRIKKNFDSLARRQSSKTKETKQDVVDNKLNECSQSEKTPQQLEEEQLLSGDLVLAAILHTEKRPEYHEEMIRNYLSTARVRFLNQPKTTVKPTVKNNSVSSSRTSLSASSVSAASSKVSTPDVSEANFATPCVNTDCKNFGTFSTNYLCSECFAKQQKELAELTTNEMNEQHTLSYKPPHASLSVQV